MAGSIIGGATAIARNDAQTLQNTKDIGALQGKVDSIPERLGRIEQALIDLKALEKQRGTARADP